jgi:hypothetical protein
MNEPAKTCPKCNGPLTVCICCGEPRLCQPCKACYGYQPPPRIEPAQARQSLNMRTAELKTA